MAYPDDKIKPPSSTSVLDAGSFKARDQMRREEHRQLQQIKLGERIDRNMNRAIRQGNSRKAESFANLKKAFNGGQIKAGGIGHHDDRLERARDGAAKGAEYRFNAGRIGEASNPIADAPPPEEKKAPASAGIGGNAPLQGGFRTPEELQAFEQSGTQAQSAAVGSPVSQEASATNPVEQQPQSAYNPGPGFSKPKSTNDALRDRQEFVDSLFRGTAQKNNAAAQQQSTADKWQQDNDQAAYGESNAKMSSALESQRSRMSPEAFASLERSINKLTPEQKKESVATGKAKGEAFAKRTDELVEQARSLIAQAEQGRRDIGQIRNEIATRNDDKTNVSGILGGNSREDFLDSLSRNPSFSTSSTMRTPADEAAVFSVSKPEATYASAPLVKADKKTLPSATPASSDDFGQMSPSDPRYKAAQIKNSAYSKAWWATPGSMIPVLRHNLDKSPQDQIKEKARSIMISDALEKGVDISEITKQDSKFHKQYEEAKKKKSEQESLKSVASYLSPSGRSFPV